MRYIDEALDTFIRVLRIYDCINKKEGSGKRFSESFNSRTSNGPTFIKNWGLIPYLTFLASKSGEQLIKESYKALAAQNNCSDYQEIDPDKFGYAVYYSSIVRYLSKLGIISISGELDVKDNIKQLLQNLHNYRVIEPILIKYLIELKKLSDAYFKKE